MNLVLDTLCCDHANFAKLLNVIEQQANLVASDKDADAYILAKAVEYLEGYPAQYHHPLEDAFCARLKKALPAADPDIDDISRQHAAIREHIAHFKKQLSRLSRGESAARADFAAMAQAFVDAEWEHMEFERTALFPAGLQAFTDEDWAYLEHCVPSFLDPLFGGDVAQPLERLHQALLACDSQDGTLQLLKTYVGH